MTKATALRDSKNNFTNYLLINVDTTEAASARSKIKEFETLFALIGDYAKVGYAVFDALSRDGYALSSWYDNIGESSPKLPQSASYDTYNILSTVKKATLFMRQAE